MTGSANYPPPIVLHVLWWICVGMGALVATAAIVTAVVAGVDFIFELRRQRARGDHLV